MEDGDFTVLRISGAEVPPFSARGLTQTITPISQASKLERAVNGELVDLSIPAMRLYSTTITCNDINVPAVSGLWPGVTVEIECVAELSYPSGSPGLQERTEVSGSIRTLGSFTFYRPILTVVFIGWNISYEEYSGNTSWSLNFEEQAPGSSPP